MLAQTSQPVHATDRTTGRDSAGRTATYFPISHWHSCDWGTPDVRLTMPWEPRPSRLISSCTRFRTDLTIVVAGWLRRGAPQARRPAEIAQRRKVRYATSWRNARATARALSVAPHTSDAHDGWRERPCARLPYRRSQRRHPPDRGEDRDSTWIGSNRSDRPIGSAGAHGFQVARRAPDT